MAEGSIEAENKALCVQSQIKQIFQSIQKQPIASLRLENYRAAFQAFSELAPQPRDVTIIPFVINGLPAEWIIPSTPIHERTILYFHSGTYIDGSLKTDRPRASILAGITHAKILQFAYHIAPEHPFPAAIYDGLAAYCWLLAQGHKPQQIALVGSAAGGGIMLEVLLRLRDQGFPLPAVAIGLSPWLNLTTEGFIAKKSILTDIVLSATLLEYATNHYACSEEASLALASPLHANLHGLPPLLLQVGQHEILRQDAHQFVERAKAFQVRAHCIVWESMFHGWHTFAGILPEGRLAFEQIAAYLENYLAS